MRTGFLAIACLIGLAGFKLALAPAAAESLMDKAKLWGELHGAAIYCGRPDTNDFGRAAMNYFKRRAGGGAAFNRLRDTYGITAIRAATSPPTPAAGGNCYGFRSKYEAVWKLLRTGKGG